MSLTQRTPDAPHPHLPQDARQRCEIWTRVMGYHRPVASFNTGKQGEFAERVYFREPGQPAEAACTANPLADTVGVHA